MLDPLIYDTRTSSHIAQEILNISSSKSRYACVFARSTAQNATKSIGTAFSKGGLGGILVTMSVINALFRSAAKDNIHIKEQPLSTETETSTMI